MFRQHIPGISLSIEEATANVPADGRFYVLNDGAIQRGYKTLRQATAFYEQLLETRRSEAAATGAGDGREPAGNP